MHKLEELDGLPPPLWERQPWDTDHAYRAFRDCYLSQPAPRRVLTAFRHWCELRQLSPKKRTSAQDYFVCWAQGYNSNGERPSGTVYEHAIPWKVRAQAWDTEQDRLTEAEWVQRRQQVKLAEFDMGETLRKRAQTMLSFAITNDWKESDLNAHADLAFKLLRRSLGMEQGRTTINWRKDLQDAGADPTAIFENLVNDIQQQLTSDASGNGTTDR